MEGVTAEQVKARNIPKIGLPNLIIRDLARPSDYVDRDFPGSRNEWYTILEHSSTLYVGNLSFYTTEEQIYELFSKCGAIKRVIMGLDKMKFTPCGFCFVEYLAHADALDCLRYINGTKLDDRFVRVDLDPGFREGRQYGRGKHGGQVRDQFRGDYDAGRGGWAPISEYSDYSSRSDRYSDQHRTSGYKRRYHNDEGDNGYGQASSRRRL